MKRCALTTVCLLAVLSLAAAYPGGQRVRLQDVQTLVLSAGRSTAGRRSAPVPQLTCKGGTAGCAYVPDTVACKNMGWDGHDVTWSCEADMPSDYKFGRITVSCEGYDYPDDPFILAGSCGLEYELELTDKGRQRRQHASSSSHSSYSSYESAYPSSSSSSSYSSGSSAYRSPYDSSSESSNAGTWFMLLVVCAIGYMFWSSMAAAPAAAGVGGMGLGGGNNGFYPGEHPEGAPYNAYTAPQGPVNNGRPGFWSGMGAGGLLGYLWGSRRANNNYYGYNAGYQQPVYPSAPRYNAYSAPSPSRHRTPSPPSTHRSTAYGTTSRR